MGSSNEDYFMEVSRSPDAEKMRIALVVGGNGGIGSAIAELFSKQGMRVYATYAHREEQARQLQKLSKYTIMRCDLTDEDTVSGTIEQIIQRDSRIDIVVNAATSRLKMKLFEDLSLSEFEEDLNIILKGSIRLCRAVVPYMKKQKFGILLHLLTATVIDPPPARMSSYVTAKAGLLGLTRALAADLSRYHIRVVGIAPSFVETGLLAAFPPKLLERERERWASKQFVSPDEIARLALAIVNNESRYPNGGIVVVRGSGDLSL